MINYHAGMIHHALDDRRQAATYLRLALKTKPVFDIVNAEIAQKTLDSISPTQARVSR